VIIDVALEEFLTSVRSALLDGKGLDAKDKILLFLNKDEDHKTESEITVDDIAQKGMQAKRDFEENDYDLANRHSEELVSMI